MIIRAVFTKRNYLRYISHLDMVRLFHRTFNMAMIPVKYSEGFNPHPKFSIGNPLSLGVESEEEYLDLEMEGDMDVKEFIEKMNKSLPEDIRILRAISLEKATSVSAMIEWSFYELKFLLNGQMELEELTNLLNKYLENEEILMKRMKKKGRSKIEVEINIRPLIGNLVVKERDKDGFVVLNGLLKSGERGNLKPVDLIEVLERDLSLGIDLESVLIKRIGQFAQENDRIYKPL